MRRLHREGRLDGKAVSKLSDLEMATLLHGGATLEEIGQLAGMTRERVRQRLKRIGITPARRLDVAKLVGVIRSQPVTSWAQVAKLTGAQPIAIEEALVALGLWAPIERLFRLRKRSYKERSRVASAASLRKYATVLGHTPRAEDLIRRDRPADVPSLGVIQKQFGSLPAAMTAAGLTPNTQGRSKRRRTWRQANGEL